MSGSAGPSTHETRLLVEAFDPGPDRELARHRRETLDLLDRVDRPFARTTYRPGHLTASAIVLTADLAHVLLVFHRRLGRWLQPGGHVEPDDRDVRATARREVVEETGVQVEWARAPLIAVDVHPIPAARGEPAHRHYDLMFGFRAVGQPVLSTRSDGGTVWCRLAEIETYLSDGACHRGIERAVRHLAHAAGNRSSGPTV